MLDAFSKSLALGPVGVFDSGIGGVTVWRHIARILPRESLIFVADQAHLPYGPKPADEVRCYAEAITEFLLSRNCKAIVVACNTASAAALKSLREDHPGVLFVGMEPAVKPAAQISKARVVGVLATPGTLRGRMFALAVERFASDVTLINQPCPGLVEAIEAGRLESPETEMMLRDLLKPIIDAGADTLVLACTHYPFVLPLIQRIAGNTLQVIDPAPSVARYLSLRLEQARLAAPESVTAAYEFLNTGDPGSFGWLLRQLTGIDVEPRTLCWNEAGQLSDRRD